MKERILTGWTITRALYLVMGSIIMIQSILNHHWLGVVFGSYFVAMGIFAFGCAAGNCISGNCSMDTNQHSNKDIPDTEFEEVITK